MPVISTFAALALTLILGVAQTPAPPSSTPPTTRVLFVGNSLTLANDLPGLITRIGHADGRRIETETIARANFSLEDHWNQADARRAIARRGWDFVVLQQGPSALPESRTLLVDYVKRFDRVIREAGAKTALYMVWPSAARRGDFPGVSQSYKAAADAVGGLLIPAGDAWRAAWAIDADLGLYTSDGFHPTPLGTALAAMVVYERLTGRPAPAVELPGVTPAQWEILRQAAERVRGSGTRLR